MTTYTAIPNTDIDADSPVNVSLMTKMRDNPIAITEGSTGAPKIQTAAYDTASVDAAAIAAGAVDESELASNAVTRIKLSTGTEERSNTGVCNNGTFTLLDGYGFLPEVKSSSGSLRGGVCTMGPGGLSNTWLFHLGSSYSDVEIGITGESSSTGTVRVRYVTSSPPYDLGDGDVGRFVYAEIDTNGAIVSTWNADDPPWAARDIRGRRRFDKATGKTYILRPDPDFSDQWGELDDAGKDQYAAFLKAPKYAWVELTNQRKNRRIAMKPTPGFNLAQPTNRVVMLDPPSDILHRITEQMQVDHDLSVSTLLHEGYLVVSNTPITRSGPPGMPIHGVSWKI